MQQETQSAGPVCLSERILFIDVLRGMALFGILAANMRGFFAPLDAYMQNGVLYHGRADVLAQVFARNAKGPGIAPAIAFTQDDVVVAIHGYKISRHSCHRDLPDVL